MSDEITQNPGTLEFWRDRWLKGQTGWDLGGPHPLLANVFEKLRNDALIADGAQVWVPGCGRGHCAAALAKSLYRVYATDLVAEAMQEATRLYGTIENLELNVEDALHLDPSRQGSFDAVFDRAVLCAISPDQRPSFVASICSALKPGGLFVTFAFTKTAREDGRAGPPFGIPILELHHLFDADFSLVSMQERSAVSIYGEGRSGALVKEATIVYRRREVAHG